MSAAETRYPGAKARVVALALCAVLGCVWIATLPGSPAWGWDESMHAELPAVRMLVALKEGQVGHAFDALLECQQYPFVWPVVLATVQLFTGVSEFAARCAGLVAWVITIFGVFLLACEIVPALGESRRGRVLAPWIALVLSALCPLALDFGGSLFLEVPFACAAVFTLRAWIRLRRGPSARRAYVAGAWIALALFTKWNYGLLLGFGVALDALVAFAIAAFSGNGRSTLALFARAAVVPAVVCSWWFVLPLPGSFALGGEHRHAFLEFLHGNLGGAETPMSRRFLYAAAFFAPTPRVLLLEIVGLLLALRFVRDPGVRTLAIVFFAAGLPVWLHPFHLDRFLIPSGPALWALSAIGIASILPAALGARAVALVLLGVGSLALAGRDSVWLADRLGELPANPMVREYALGILEEHRALLRDRFSPAGGLARTEFDQLMDLVVRESGPDQRVGWLGASSETSPAVVHLALLAHHGSRERFLRDAAEPMDLTIEGADPHVDDRALLAYAERFDVIFATDPPDVRDRSVRRFMKSYRERLIATGQWTEVAVGEVELARPMNTPQRVTLYACRRKT